MSTSPTSPTRMPEAVRLEFDVLAKAFAGAALFGMPLLFTMEMWWIGEVASAYGIVGFLAIAFLLNVALARLSGFRDEHGTWTEHLAQACEAMAVGIVASCAVLLALGRLGLDASPGGSLGTIAVQVVPLSLGALIANLVFRPDQDRVHGDGDGAELQSPARELVSDVAATFAGAVFLCFAIAPTEEIPMLAAALSTANVVGIIALSLFASYLVVFASGFDPSHHQAHPGGLFQRPFSETVLAYLVSILAAAMLLLGFGQVEAGDPVHAILVKVVVLALPACIGGAAGRVVV